MRWRSFLQRQRHLLLHWKGLHRDPRKVQRQTHHPRIGRREERSLSMAWQSQIERHQFRCLYNFLRNDDSLFQQGKQGEQDSVHYEVNGRNTTLPITLNKIQISPLKSREV